MHKLFRYLDPVPDAQEILRTHNDRKLLGDEVSTDQTENYTDMTRRAFGRLLAKAMGYGAVVYATSHAVRHLAEQKLFEASATDRQSDNPGEYAPAQVMEIFSTALMKVGWRHDMDKAIEKIESKDYDCSYLKHLADFFTNECQTMPNGALPVVPNNMIYAVFKLDTPFGIPVFNQETNELEITDPALNISHDATGTSFDMWFALHAAQAHKNGSSDIGDADFLKGIKYYTDVYLTNELYSFFGPKLEELAKTATADDDRIQKEIILALSSAAEIIADEAAKATNTHNTKNQSENYRNIYVYRYVQLLLAVNYQKLAPLIPHLQKIAANPRIIAMIMPELK